MYNVLCFLEIIGGKMNTDLLLVLKESVYGNIRQYWEQCSLKMQNEICCSAEKNALGPYLYRFLHDVLPGEYKPLFKQQYTANSFRTLIYQKGLMELCQLFEQKQIRFCVLKGGDFAFQYYPDPAMRYFCDLDIWFHPDDCEKALDVLKNDGWNAPYLRTQQIEEHHHYTPHIKNGITLEPHWALHAFLNSDPVQLWQIYLTQNKENPYRYDMTPEIKILSLCRHFASNEYMHMPLYKFLLDAAWILKKENIDWEKLRQLTASFGYESCNDLLGSQYEFFPPELIYAIAPDKEGAASFRKLFELQQHLLAKKSVAAQMQAHNRFSKLWFLARFHAVTPIAIRKKYKLPEKGAYLRVYSSMFYDMYRKSFEVILSLFQQDPVKKEYNAILKKLSSHLK